MKRLLISSINFMPNYDTSTFANPYHLLQPGQDGVRVALTIDRQHHIDFKMLRIQHGTITTIFNLMFLKLHEECEKNGFFDKTSITTPQELEQAIALMEIKLNVESKRTITTVNRTTGNKSPKRVSRSTVGKSGEQGNV